MRKKDFEMIFGGEPPLTGPCPINTYAIIKLWDETYSIAQWNDTYRLIKVKRIGKESTEIKNEITPEDAWELIELLGLISVKDSTFNNAHTWRTRLHHEYMLILIEVNLYKSMRKGKIAHITGSAIKEAVKQTRKKISTQEDILFK